MVLFLFNENLRAVCGFTSKARFLYLLERYNTIFCGVYREIFAHESTLASNFSAAGLAYDNLTSEYFLAAEKLGAKAFADYVAFIADFTAGFDV